MEAAALFAVAEFRKVKLAQILYVMIWVVNIGTVENGMSRGAFVRNVSLLRLRLA